ncbi:MAG: hypothetical protein H6625_12475 [Bdellovibrionaceae bacterium]|nr:hypothetical protein [Pseudobdellovibrionaceae bacterium]
MKYLIFALIACSTLSAYARPHCVGTCTLIGPNIHETQTVSYFDDFLEQGFHIGNLDGHEISGSFSYQGGGYCGKLISVGVSVDGKRYSWKGNEVIFSIAENIYKFSCEYKGWGF